MQTYLFYDIETTGLNKAFDQILQFAAIRTDADLNELQRYELNIKLNTDLVPNPQALITHRIGIQKSLNGMSEFTAIKNIHAWMNEPGTISLGYNTLGFDDEFLRFSFYRNLLSPYSHQYANACGRMDIFPIVTLFYLFKPDVIKWPKSAEGKLSLKLEALNAANQFAQGQAHNALVDVEATLALTRCLFAEKEMWDYATGFFKKHIDQTRSQKTEGLMIFNKFGTDHYFQAPVLFLGQHRHYRNQQLWLRLDSKNFADMQPDDFHDFKLVVNKKIGEPGFIFPYTERYACHLVTERQTLAAANKKWLEQNPAQLQYIVNHHAEFKYPTFPDTDVEAGLYLNGFWNDADLIFCKHFHEADSKMKATLTTQASNPFLKSLATRILGRHFPDIMNETQKAEFSNYVNNLENIIDFRGEKRFSHKAALSLTTDLRAQRILDEEQLRLLTELEVYLESKKF